MIDDRIERATARLRSAATRGAVNAEVTVNTEDLETLLEWYEEMIRAEDEDDDSDHDEDEESE